MAHFAKLDMNDEVIEVVVLDNSKIIAPNGQEAEVLGQTFLYNLTGHRSWKQTSYSSAFRKNFAGIGYKYHSDIDAFVPPKPFDSWILDEEKGVYRAPVNKPDEELQYRWDEDFLNWRRVI